MSADDDLQPGAFRGESGPDEPSPEGENEEDLVELLGLTSLFGSGHSDGATWPTAGHASGEGQAVFCIENSADSRLTFSAGDGKGPLSRRITGWQVDFGALNVQMNDLGRFISAYYERGDLIGRTAWRYTAEQIGMHLYSGLLRVDALLAQRLMAMRRKIAPSDRLTLAFAGPRPYLSVPYELLHDGLRPLAVTHPLCRQMPGMPGRPPGLTAVVDRLRLNEDPLRILLIAADGADSPSEAEVSVVYAALAERVPTLDLSVQVDVLAGSDLRPDSVRARLTQCPYHLVHYAGQLHHIPASPGRGGLLFAQHPGLGHALLTLEELTHLLQHSQTAVFFISAPMTPRDWGEFVLRDVDYLDPLIAPLRAGVSTVLGLRWFANESSKRKLAASFYSALLSDPFAPELALLSARRHIYERGPLDETWASPMLVTQAIYGPSDQERT